MLEMNGRHRDEPAGSEKGLAVPTDCGGRNLLIGTFYPRDTQPLYTDM